MHDITWLTRLLALPLLVAAAAAPVILLGCGCSYGTATAVTITPDRECLQIDAYAHCAWLDLLGTNDCEDPLIILPVDDVEPVEVLPGESFEIDVHPYADMETDDEYCTTDVEVAAELGEQKLRFRFEVERINRGLRLPCD